MLNKISEFLNLRRYLLFYRLGFEDSIEACTWLVLAVFLIPVSFYLRLYFLSNALIEPHPIRQTQTALTIYYFAKKMISFWDYKSPFNGLLWQFIVDRFHCCGVFAFIFCVSI